MTSRFRSFLASRCRKIKRKSRYQGTKVTLRIKIIHLCGLLAKRAKILLSNPETSLTTPRLLPLRRSRRSYGNYQSPQSSGSSRNILKRLGRSGRSGRSYGNQALTFHKTFAVSAGLACWLLADLVGFLADRPFPLLSVYTYVYAYCAAFSLERYEKVKKKM